MRRSQKTFHMRGNAGGVCRENLSLEIDGSMSPVTTGLSGALGGIIFRRRRTMGQRPLVTRGVMSSA
jgi:hypothetical protein